MPPFRLFLPQIHRGRSSGPDGTGPFLLARSPEGRGVGTNLSARSSGPFTRWLAPRCSTSSCSPTSSEPAGSESSGAGGARRDARGGELSVPGHWTHHRSKRRHPRQLTDAEREQMANEVLTQDEQPVFRVLARGHPCVQHQAKAGPAGNREEDRESGACTPKAASSSRHMGGATWTPSVHPPATPKKAKLAFEDRPTRPDWAHRSPRSTASRRSKRAVFAYGFM